MTTDHSSTAGIPMSRFAGLRARTIGPADQSGRIMAIAVVERDPTTFYVGGATSGVWKTTDGGFTFTPIFDDQETASIGAISVDQAHPDIVWVGTGEGKPRYGTGVGTGLYRSRDGGASWERLGLEQSERIQRIVLHPTDPDIAWVAVVGPQWRDGEERGVYRTTDGGKTWHRLLFTNARSGCADLAIHRDNPDRLIAAMWEFRREPWNFVSGGPGSGLFVTDDGGDSWQQVTPEQGIPSGTLGRIGLGVARSDPSIVYAAIEAETNGLYRSDDGGWTWQLMSDDPNHWGIVTRTWYAQNVDVDPTNPDRVYYGASDLKVSDDAGRTWRMIAGYWLRPEIHGDFHPLWINPADPRYLLAGSDGGIYESRSGGDRWRFVENLPFLQYYQISVDMETPYNIYGNIQDNIDNRVPSSVLGAGGIRDRHVRRMAGGEQGIIEPLTNDARYVYTSHQQGMIQIEDTATGMATSLMPTSPDSETLLRFNVRAGQAVDPFEPDTVYIGSQFLHRSRDRGRTWEIISPDLTTNDPAKQHAFLTGGTGGLTYEGYGGEHHTTIVTIVPSPSDSGVIWVGTDDGNIQRTQDAGLHWTNVGERIASRSTGWVSAIVPSVSNPSTTFVVIDDHRRGDFDPHVYRTDDDGATWTTVTLDGVRGNAFTLVQDPIEPRLLFLGTEFGLWLSLDDGMSWSRWRHGLPTVAVSSLVIHPREHDLVIGTFGRGIFVLDDIRPLRQLAADPALLDVPAHIFPIEPVIQFWINRSENGESLGDTVYSAENRPYGALISYTGTADGGGDALVEITDSHGRHVRSLTGTATNGINRLVWDLRYGSDVQGWGWPNTAEELPGPHITPGTYSVQLRIGEHQGSGTVEVLPDPRMTIPVADREAKLSALQRLQALLQAIHQHHRSAVDALHELDTITSRSDKDTQETISDLRSRLTLTAELVRHTVPQALGHPVTIEVKRETGSIYGLNGMLGFLYGRLEQSWLAPTEADLVEIERVRVRADNVASRLSALLGELAHLR